MIYFLIGMMASGKTTLGYQLAHTLDYTFLDTDQLIEIYKNKSIKDIINEDGIERFREIEQEIFQNVNLKDKTVVSCGGGSVLSKVNLDVMKQKGKIIYLKVPIDELSKRLNQINITTRPLLVGDVENKLKSIYQERKDLYEQAADIVIDCEHLTQYEILIKMLNQIRTENEIVEPLKKV